MYFAFNVPAVFYIVHGVVYSFCLSTVQNESCKSRELKRWIPEVNQFGSRWGVLKKVNICYSAPNRLSHHRGARVHGAHQAASHIPALNLPSRSRYSFTDHERMEGWVSPDPGCKEQLAHGCYATVASGTRTPTSRSLVEHAVRVVDADCFADKTDYFKKYERTMDQEL